MREVVTMTNEHGETMRMRSNPSSPCEHLPDGWTHHKPTRSDGDVKWLCPCCGAVLYAALDDPFLPPCGHCEEEPVLAEEAADV